jgi:hypothetical protein
LVEILKDSLYLLQSFLFAFRILISIATVVPSEHLYRYFGCRYHSPFLVTPLLILVLLIFVSPPAPVFLGGACILVLALWGYLILIRLR